MKIQKNNHAQSSSNRPSSAQDVAFHRPAVAGRFFTQNILSDYFPVGFTEKDIEHYLITYAIYGCDLIQNQSAKNKCSHRRRTRLLKAKGSFTQQEFTELCNKYGNKCLCCGATDKKLHADHIISLKNHGTNDIGNIQPLCKPCNSKKHIKTIDYRPKNILNNEIHIIKNEKILA
jgi:5-methylcytosine-specific restriction endonuclease McrA